MDLSIVIPAYNEAHKIARDVHAAGVFLQAHRLTGEVIVADDGSTDGTASAALDAQVPPGIDLHVARLPHEGKGAAVRAGIRMSHGDYVMFADSGLCVPFEDALVGLELLRAGQLDIANGSRKLPGSHIGRPQSVYRRLLSWAFRQLILAYLDLPRELTDTQCGFKIYGGDVARELYAACRESGFLFDLEILMRATAAGFRIGEFPVHWTCDRDSRLKPARIFHRTFEELVALKRRMAAERTHEPAPAKAEV